MRDRVEEELNRLRNWNIEDLQVLLDKLETMVRQQESAKTQQFYKARDFRGIGKETWKDVDVEEYIKQERASWEDASKRISDQREQTGQSITELRGVGKEFWQGIDVEEYIKQERASWDG